MNTKFLYLFIIAALAIAILPANSQAQNQLKEIFQAQAKASGMYMVYGENEEGKIRGGSFMVSNFDSDNGSGYVVGFGIYDLTKMAKFSDIKFSYRVNGNWINMPSENINVRYNTRDHMKFCFIGFKNDFGQIVPVNIKVTVDGFGTYESYTAVLKK